MNKIVVVKICIVLSHIFILVNITTANRGLLNSASCKYLGESDPDGKRCRKDKVKFEKLPEECSAFIFDGVQCDNMYNIIPRYYPEDLDNIKSLINFKGNDDEFHDVYVFYKHEALSVDCGGGLGNPEMEAIGVKQFINDYPVKGLILDEFINTYIYEEPDDFYTDLAAYVETIKTGNPGLEIGFYLSAGDLTRNKIDGISSLWFDFVKMNDILDFYLIEFVTFNQCNELLLNGGITPMDSPADNNIMTLNTFAHAFENCTIDKEKVYFEFLISPIVEPEFKDDFWHCETSYNEYCENRDKYSSTWCVDNQNVLYEKGKFAKKYSKGFIGRDIDLVDRDDNCKCGDKYITFHMMLRGYNDEKDPLTCDAFI